MRVSVRFKSARDKNIIQLLSDAENLGFTKSGIVRLSLWLLFLFMRLFNVKLQSLERIYQITEGGDLDEANTAEK